MISVTTMNALAINYRYLSYETLTRIIDLANRLGVTPEEAAKRYLLEYKWKNETEAA